MNGIVMQLESRNNDNGSGNKISRKKFMHGRLIEDCHCDKEMDENVGMGILKLEFRLIYF